MKTKYLLIAALAGLALVGCNKEAGKEDGPVEGEKSYMAFNIIAPNSMTKGSVGSPEFDGIEAKAN